MHLKALIQFIGHLRLEQVHMGTLQSFIEARQRQGTKTKSINLALGVVRHLLNQAASEWIDGNGLTWITSPPKIKLLPVLDAREPYPITWDEQAKLFKELPAHLARMALFKVNTGCRQEEVCQLKWDWECRVPELRRSVFIIPAGFVKNREDRLVVLNSVAKSVIEEVRGQHKEHVFIYQGHKVGKINNSAWKRARKIAGLEQVRVHDLKHTFGRRLRAAGVPLETRKVLLGHRNKDITTHYSAPELAELIEAVQRVAERGDQAQPTLTILRKRIAG
jgi:integrase